jgi:iron complex outermembrane receptor protein
MAGQLIPFSQPEKADDQTSTRSIFPQGQFDDTTATNYSLNVDWNVGEHTLTAITGWVEFDFKRRSTATAFTELFVDTEISEDYDQFSQELRLVSPKGSMFDYVAGVYYSMDDSQIAQWSPFTVPFNNVFSTGIRSYSGEGKSRSAYFSGTLHFADDRFRATFGLRYGEDSLDGNSRLSNGTYDRVADVFNTIPDFTFIPPGASNQEFNLFSSRSEDYTLPSGNLQFDVTEEVMIYASYAEGFKGGGFLANDSTTGNNVLAEVARTTTNGVSSWARTYAGLNTITPAQLLAGVALLQDNGIYDYRPEEATSYELGAKMKFAGGTVRWNVALFDTEFIDLQTSQYDGVRFITRNAAEATSRGIESELDWRVNENVTLSLDFAYLDAEYDEYTNTFCKVIAIDGTQEIPSCVSGQGDLSGERLERAPEFEATLSGSWEGPLTQGTRLRIDGSIYYSDEYYIQANVSPLYVQDAFLKYDLRVGVADADDRWEVALIGRNLSDELTFQHAFLVGRYSVASLSTPRYITLQGTWKF